MKNNSYTFGGHSTVATFRTAFIDGGAVVSCCTSAAAGLLWHLGSGWFAVAPRLRLVCCGTSVAAGLVCAALRIWPGFQVCLGPGA